MEYTIKIIISHSLNLGRLSIRNVSFSVKIKGVGSMFITVVCIIFLIKLDGLRTMLSYFINACESGLKYTLEKFKEAPSKP